MKGVSLTASTKLPEIMKTMMTKYPPHSWFSKASVIEIAVEVYIFDINKMKIVVLILSGIMASSPYTEDKVFNYFKHFDLNKNGLLEREEYERKLEEEDKQNMIEE